MKAAAMAGLQALQREWDERGKVAIEDLRESDPAAFVMLAAAVFPDAVGTTLRELLACERRQMN